MRSVLFVHGSAADSSTWTFQLAALRRELKVVAYDRVATGDVAEHAAEAADVIIDRCAGGPVIAVGSSFGAIVVLELARSWPELVRGMVLCEPPLSPYDSVPATPQAYGCGFDRIVAQYGGHAAAEMFLRTVLGDELFDKMPEQARKRACSNWKQIRADSRALLRYEPRYDDLERVDLATLLLGGERSGHFFEATLETLELRLPNARIEMIPNAGHMMQVEAARRFNELLVQFARSVYRD